MTLTQPSQAAALKGTDLRKCEKLTRGQWFAVWASTGIFQIPQIPKTLKSKFGNPTLKITVPTCKRHLYKFTERGEKKKAFGIRMHSVILTGFELLYPPSGPSSSQSHQVWHVWHFLILLSCNWFPATPKITSMGSATTCVQASKADWQQLPSKDQTCCFKQRNSESAQQRLR